MVTSNAEAEDVRGGSLWRGVFDAEQNYSDNKDRDSYVMEGSEQFNI